MKRWLALLLLFALPPSALAGQYRDPLTPSEVEQLREAKLEPPKRMKLFVKFATARMVAIDQLRSDPNLAEGRGQKLHDLLQDLRHIVDEIGRNLQMYEEQNADLRKPLKEVIEGVTALQLKLRTLKEAQSNPAVAKEARDYEFALEDAIEQANITASIAREILDDQTAEFEARKKKK